MKSPYVSPVPISYVETTAALIVILLGGLLFFSDRELPSPFARHMLEHAVTMNMLAPVVAWKLTARFKTLSASVPTLIISTSLQLVLLASWHMPSIFPHVHESTALTMAMHVSLLASALMFWMSVFSLSSRRPLWSIATLLVTGKLYCLYGVLLIFASRELFAHPDHAHHVVTQADQQLAGLIMITACPLTYVAAAVAFVVKWMKTWEGASSVKTL